MQQNQVAEEPSAINASSRVVPIFKIGFCLGLTNSTSMIARMMSVRKPGKNGSSPRPAPCQATSWNKTQVIIPSGSLGSAPCSLTAVGKFADCNNRNNPDRQRKRKAKQSFGQMNAGREIYKNRKQRDSQACDNALQDRAVRSARFGRIIGS